MNDDLAAAIAAELEHLANVPPGALRGVLAACWAPGDAEIARSRIEALRREFVNRAAAARRAAAVRPNSDVRQVIDNMRRLYPKMTKKRAFERVAAERNMASESVRNAYYASLPHELVITESLCD